MIFKKSFSFGFVFGWMALLLSNFVFADTDKITAFLNLEQSFLTDVEQNRTLSVEDWKEKTLNDLQKGKENLRGNLESFASVFSRTEDMIKAIQTEDDKEKFITEHEAKVRKLFNEVNQETPAFSATTADSAILIYSAMGLCGYGSLAEKASDATFITLALLAYAVTLPYDVVSFPFQAIYTAYKIDLAKEHIEENLKSGASL